MNKRKKKKKSYVLWISILAGLIFLVGTLSLLYAGRGKIRTWMTFRGKEPIERGKIYARLNRHSEAISEFKKEIEKNPTSFEAHYNLGHSFRRLGEFDQALSEYELARSLAPDSSDTGQEISLTYLNKAIQYRNTGKNDAEVAEYLQKAMDACDEMLAGNPQDYKSLVLKGKVYLEMHDSEKAANSFQEALDIENDYIPAHLGLINLYMLSGNYEKVESQCMQALKLKPEDFSINLNLAIVYSQQGRLEEAIEILDRTGSNRQTRLQTNIMKGLVYLRMGRYRDADKTADAASEIASGNVPVLDYIHGVCAFQAKDYTRAVERLRQATTYMPNSAEAHYFLALSLIQTNKKEEAKTELVSAINSTNEFTPAKLALAQLMTQEARWDEAVTYAKEVLKLHPDNAVAIQLLGMAYQAQGKTAEARREFTRLKELSPSAPAGISLAYLSLTEGKVGECLKICDEILAEHPNQYKVLYLKGLALLRSRNLPKAHQCFKETLELQPGFTPAVNQLAKISLITGKKDEAITLLTDNLKNNQEDIASHLLLARIYEEEDIGHAKEEVEKAISVDEGYVPAYVALGRISMASGDYTDAVGAYEKAAGLQPSSAALHIGLGTAYHSVEDLEGARAEFKEAIRLAPNSPFAYVMLSNVYLNENQPDAAVNIIEESYLSQEQKELYLGFIQDFTAAAPSLIVLQHLNEAIFFELNRSYTKALERCREIDTAMPNNTLVSMYLGNLLMAKGESKEAVEVFEGLALSDGLRLPATLYQQMGRTYLLMKDYKKARWALEEAVATNREAPSTRLQLSQLYLQEGNTEKAQSMAEDVLLQDPDNALALNLIGQAHLLKGELEEAEANFSKAASDGRFQNLSSYNLARTLLAKGEVDQCIETCKAGLEKNPLNAGLHYLLGNALMSKGNAAKALEEFTSITESNPYFLPAYLKIAAIHYQRGRVDLALPVCNLALESNPDSVPARLMLAGCYVGLGRYDEAVEEYNQCLNRANNHPRALFGLATARLLNGDESGALETLQTLLEQKDNPPRARILLAEIYKRQSQIPLAIQTLEELVNTAPKSVPLVTLASLYIQQGEYDKCIKITGGTQPYLLWIRATANQLKGQFQEAENNYNEALQGRQGDISITMSLANLAIGSGQKEKAKTVIEHSRLSSALKRAYLDLIDATPDDTASEVADRLNAMLVYTAASWVKQAIIECEQVNTLVPGNVAVSNFLANLFVAAGDTEDAIDTFASIIQADSTFSPAYARLAALYLRAGDNKNALDAYRDLSEVEPDSGQALLQVATLLEKQGNYGECIEEYRKVIDLAPKSTSGVIASNNLAWVLATEKGRIDESLEYALKAREMAPNNAGVRDTLGWIYYLNEQYTEAIKELQQATRLAFGNPTMHFHLGATYLKKGMDSRALAQLKKAVKAKVDFPEEEEAKRLIREIISRMPEGTPLSAL